MTAALWLLPAVVAAGFLGWYWLALREHAYRGRHWSPSRTRLRLRRRRPAHRSHELPGGAA